MPQHLKDLDGKEVSIVDRAANRRRFLLLKAEGDTMDEVKALQTIEKLDADGMGEAIEALAGADPVETAELLKATMTDEEKKKLRAAMRVMGSDVAKKLPGFLRAAGLAEDDDEDKKEKKKMTKSDETVAQITKNDKGEWDLSAVPDAQRPGLEAVLKAADAREVQLRAELQKAADEKAAAEEKANTLAAEKERTEAIAKCADFKGLPGLVADDFAATLVKIRKAVEPAEYDKFTAILKAAATVVRKSPLFEEIGTGEQGSRTAHAELTQKAAELRKNDPKLSPEAARARVYKSDPDLMQRVTAEDAERRRQAQE